MSGQYGWTFVHFLSLHSHSRLRIIILYEDWTELNWSFYIYDWTHSTQFTWVSFKSAKPAVQFQQISKATVFFVPPDKSIYTKFRYYNTFMHSFYMIGERVHVSIYFLTRDCYCLVWLRWPYKITSNSWCNHLLFFWLVILFLSLLKTFPRSDMNFFPTFRDKVTTFKGMLCGCATQLHFFNILT
jgi:hypothetical protein